MIWLFLLYFATIFFTIQTIRMIILEILQSKVSYIDSDYFSYVWYIPTCILWAICLII